MKEYGKILNGSNEIVCTVQDFWKFIKLVKAEECPEGFTEILKIVPKPEPKDGEVLWFRYVMEDGFLKKHYFYRKPPRILSKLNIYTVLQPLGLYDNLMEILKSFTLPNGINGFKAYEEANEISEEYSLYLQAFDTIRQQLGLTEEEADRIVEQCKQSNV